MARSIRTVGMGAVAAAGAVLGPLGASAAVIQTYPGDGADIVFGTTTEFTYVPYTGRGALTVNLTGSSSALINVSGSGIAIKLQAGTTVGPTPFAYGAQTSSIDATSTPSYVGLELVGGTAMNPTYNFGYAEFDSSEALLGYAFESSPDTGITVVDVVPGGAQPPAAGGGGGGTDVPEPGSLAMLAAGVAVVGSIRRRRAAAIV